MAGVDRTSSEMMAKLHGAQGENKLKWKLNNLQRNSRKNTEYKVKIRKHKWNITQKHHESHRRNRQESPVHTKMNKQRCDEKQDIVSA